MDTVRMPYRYSPSLFGCETHAKRCVFRWIGICIFCIFTAFTGCAGDRDTSAVSAAVAETEPLAVTPSDELSPDEAAKRAAEDTAPKADAERRRRAQEIAAGLDDNALSAQVIMAGVDGNGVLGEGMARLLREHPPGALMLFSYNLKADKEIVTRFLSNCSAVVAEQSVAPFIAVDHEGGNVHRFAPDVQRLPSAESFRWQALAVGEARTLKEIEDAAFRSGREIHGMGVTMNLAPVAEILNAENAAFLGTRSYGSDPLFVEKACVAFITGMGRAGVACVVKHFPGNAAVDPHESLPVINANATELSAMSRPFAGLISGANHRSTNSHGEELSAIMISHAIVKAWDEERNGSLSPLVIEDWLRGELGFDGVVIADDFSMGAVAASGIRETDAVG